MTLPIFTDANGVPLPGRPDPLPEGATIQDKIAHMRACNAYRDAAGDRFHETFNKRFRARSQA